MATTSSNNTLASNASMRLKEQLFDLNLLRSIIMVADCGSYTTTARLHSAQPMVSQKVRRLEDMVGHKLLDRGNREVHATDAGELLLGYALQRQRRSVSDYFGCASSVRFM